MKIGVVCPYAWDIPGGVQNHVRDLAEHLIRLGHEVSVLAPADDEALAARLRHARRPRGAGAVQRLGRARELRLPVRRAGAALAARRRLRRAARPRALLAEPVDAGLLGRLRADRRHLPHRQPALAGDDRRLPDPAADAGEDQRPHRGVRIRPPHPGGAPRRRRGGDPERRRRRLLRSAPNPRRSGRRSRARAAPSPSSAASTSPARAWPRCMEAFPEIAEARPGVRLLVLGGGDIEEAAAFLPDACAARWSSSAGSPTGQSAPAVERGRLRGPEPRRRELRHHPGRGDVRGSPGLASDLDAFGLVLQGGRSAACSPRRRPRPGQGRHRPPRRRRRTRAPVESAALAVRRYDWSVVAKDLLAVYEMVTTNPASLARAGGIEVLSAGEVLES